MSEETVVFNADSLRLEGILHIPNGNGPFPGVVMCHPHPLFGGNYFNNVVLAVCQALAESSIIALRFNFRGVGKSQGRFSDGIGERNDIKAAITFLSSVGRISPACIGLAGYSYGGMVALPVSLQDERVKALLLISPPLNPSDWQQLEDYVKPKLILCGTKDPFVTPPVSTVHTEQYEAIPEADHFWWGYEDEIAKKVSSFFSDAFCSS